MINESVIFQQAPRSAERQDQFGECIGSSAQLTQIFERLRALVEDASPVLIQGERGTGKRSLLMELHRLRAATAHYPIVTVDCSAQSDNAIAQMLLGTPGGAPSALQQASGGALLLLHIDSLALDAQAALASQYSSLGHKPRLLATSLSSIEEQYHRGAFSDVLFEIFSKVRLVLPPLRSRPMDILSLARHLLWQRQTAGKAPTARLKLGRSEEERLLGHAWPGNVKELKQVIDQAIETASGETTVLPITFTPQQPANGEQPAFDPQLSYRETRAKFEAEFETRYVRWLLARHSGNISAASREARMDRKYLYDLARKHGLRGQRNR